jgi:type IV secretion system protein TrbL
VEHWLVNEGCDDLGLTAGLGERAGCAFSDTAQGVLETLFNMLVMAATWAVSWTGEAWLSFPEPTIGTADGTPSENIAELWSLGSFYIMGIAVLTFLLAVIRLLMNPSMQSGAALARGIVAIITVQALGIGGTALLLDAGNQYSVWVVEEASGKDFETALADFSGLGGTTSTFAAAGAVSQHANIVLFAALGFGVLLLAAAAQVALLIVRSALLVVLMAFLPFLAAAAFTDGGYKGLGKAIGWITALVLYKPVAGTIYAVGVLTLKNAAEDAEATEQMMNLLIGVVIVAAAALALPALVKFVAPQAAVGASMAFSAGAAAPAAAGAAPAAARATAPAATTAAEGGVGTNAAGGPKAPSNEGTPEGVAGAAPSGAPAPEGAGRGDTPVSAPGSESTADANGDSAPSGHEGGGSTLVPAGQGGSREGGGSPESSGVTDPSDGDPAPANAPATTASGSSNNIGNDSASAPRPPEDGPAESSAGPDGAEPASAPVATASGAAPKGAGPDAVRAVRDVAAGVHSGAQQVDFNEGQEHG